MIGAEHERNGLRLAVADRGMGAAVVFGHGLCGDARQPAEVFPLEDFRCITVESRGHGNSEPGACQEFSIATFADDLVHFLERRKLGPITIGGISMGAAIALRIAVVRPDLVGGLILARPAWLTSAAPPNMRPNAFVGELLARFTSTEARARFEQSEVARELTEKAPGNAASLRSFFAREPREITAALLTRISADGPGVSREDVEALTIPTLVIGHDRDLIHPLTLANELASLIAHARLAVITPKADDGERYVAEFRAAMRAFLTENAK